MTQEEIIRMAREAGFMVVAEGEPDIGDWYECFVDEIKLFAALVAAHERKKCFDAAMKAAEKAVDVAIAMEREACAKVVNDDRGLSDDDAIRLMRAIRGRGEE